MHYKAELANLVNKISSEQPDYHQAVSFEQFVRAAEDFRAGMKTESELRLAFQILDKARTGFIEVAELRRLLTTCGEPLSMVVIRVVVQDKNLIFSRDKQRSSKIFRSAGSDKQRSLEFVQF